jgi:hypothetical protein
MIQQPQDIQATCITTEYRPSGSTYGYKRLQLNQNGTNTEHGTTISPGQAAATTPSLHTATGSFQQPVVHPGWLAGRRWLAPSTWECRHAFTRLYRPLTAAKVQGPRCLLSKHGHALDSTPCVRKQLHNKKRAQSLLLHLPDSVHAKKEDA